MRGFLLSKREETIMEYGIQLYSVKDFMAKDVKGTLGELAAMGYTMV